MRLIIAETLNQTLVAACRSEEAPASLLKKSRRDCENGWKPPPDHPSLKKPCWSDSQFLFVFCTANRRLSPRNNDPEYTTTV